MRIVSLSNGTEIDITAQTAADYNQRAADLAAHQAARGIPASSSRPASVTTTQ